MSMYYKEYKDQIEPYKWLLVERIKDVQVLLRDRNRILASNGASFIPVYATDLVEACRNLIDVIPPDVRASIGKLEELLEQISSVEYEELLVDTGQARALKLLESLVMEAHMCLRSVISSLASKGLLLRSKGKMGAVEE